MDNAKKNVWLLGWPPNTHTSAHHGLKKLFWIPGMGVFEMGDATKYCLGSGVTPHTPIPLHPVG